MAVVMQDDLPPPGMQRALNTNEIDWKDLQQMGSDWLRQGPKLEEDNRNEEDLPSPRWYIVQCTPGLEDNVKMMLQSKISNSAWLQKTILEVRHAAACNGTRTRYSMQPFPGYLVLTLTRPFPLSTTQSCSLSLATFTLLFLS